MHVVLDGMQGARVGGVTYQSPMPAFRDTLSDAGRARSRLGENDYRLLTNNGEHFCNWCRSGVSHSAQVQRLPFRLLGALVSFVTDASKFAIR